MRSKRIDLVENYIINHKTVSIDKLCEVFDVSKNTIRRDLSVLVEKGTIKKVYGGVTVNENQELVSFEERNVKNSNSKLALGKAAAEFIEDGDSIFLDSGTTTVNIIDFLKDKKDITGYKFEPWHYRYVGTDISYDLKDGNTTLEEYFNLE